MRVAKTNRAGFGSATWCALVLALAVAGSAEAQTKPAVTWSPAYTGNYTHYGSTGRGISYVVIHTIEGTAGGAISWFKNSAAKVSAHYVVDYSGAITQMVADGDIAWHAGNYDYNRHSIGIEHAGYAGKDYWTDAEYRASAKLVRWACLTYGIPMDRSHVIGHIEVPGATHTDPGRYFKWDYFMGLVRDGSATPPPPSAGLSARTVATGSLNVRSGPGTGYSLVGTAGSGQSYMKISASGDWYKIYYKGGSAWFHGGYTSATAHGSAAKVTSSTLNVRTGPATSYAVAGTVSLDQLYYVVSTSSGWHKIWWGGGAYWIYGGYSTKVSF